MSYAVLRLKKKMIVVSGAVLSTVPGTLLSVDSFRADPALHSFPTRRSSDLTGMSGLSSIASSRGRLRRRTAPRRSSATCRAVGAGDIKVRLLPLGGARRSEEHTSELQSRRDVVCRPPLEKKDDRRLRRRVVDRARYAAFCRLVPRRPSSALFPYTTLFRSHGHVGIVFDRVVEGPFATEDRAEEIERDLPGGWRR